MLREISQVEKDRYHMFSSMCVEPEKLSRRPWGRRWGKKVIEREGGKPKETLKY